jgi:transposase-like protein
MKQVVRIVKKGKRQKLKYVTSGDALGDRFETLTGPINSKHELISMMLPSAVKAFFAELEGEVKELCGDRYEHDKSFSRWGKQSGSIVLGNQQVAIKKPRVRDAKNNREVDLKTYERFQDPRQFDEAVFTDGIRHVSQRDYEKGVKKIVNSFGFSKSSVSRRWIEATKEKLDELMTRDLKPLKIKAVFLDGKRFKTQGVIVALGIGETAHKSVLGLYQASTENSEACLKLLNDLESRGLASEGLIFIVDGGSGLNKALNEKYNCDDPLTRKAVRIRCHVHKWWNLEDILGDQSKEIKSLFWSLRECKDMAEARRVAEQIENILGRMNKSALKNFQDVKDDLLVIHSLNMSQKLKRFFSTTNPIESLNSLLEEDLRRVKRWKDSGHFQRWFATSALHSERRMRRIHGYSQLAAVWIRLRDFLPKPVSTQEDVGQGVAG